ncbi:hypothetical protein A3G55_01890 [Candidatus Giovannonibacteria bacterium RIFCSPLOWO2_12_FULL_44_25]|uniref:Uncharacterized protein n=2 Tax=Candidatus Giovannoniibacteriota TaxID=1752738 RepID=A0A0G1KV56_9BACT|nr:MAG: hypothetical protein UW15_C0024G0012 [Parcubacteria group bacterium GW2011_GWC1_44_10]KKT60197.1 MAG: hypothetical protein UW53_C0003G0108 [Candidatus Giovannonibacteria bacterium GW2011_GWA1_44_25]KKU30044.1 MAG: hypothetical protein UX43_C0003G0137 [Candidatus Giovannonibacteria bacterium GW2011_GWB1_46_20]OGF49401.1 MAG: hypothetical protein A2120_03725 [Candidatus Giovannonibacteria bacterium GWA2_45_15]OGF61067.1 MAG: hypothetical protein A2656_02340 [Candidatus Giovannonibacteria 
MSTLYSIGHMNQLADALEKAGFSVEEVTKLRKYDLGTIKAVLNGFSEIKPIERLVTVGDVVPAPEVLLDFIISVDRSVKPSYPGWMKKVMHPELELVGPAEYNLNAAVGLWLHNDQKTGVAIGNAIYKHLQKDNALADCLGLADLLAIQTKGIAVFRKLYAGKTVFGWKSVVQDRYGRLDVPCLCGYGGGVVLLWYWLGCSWYSNDPALRFSK